MYGNLPQWEHKIPTLNFQHQDLSERREVRFNSSVPNVFGAQPRKANLIVCAISSFNNFALYFFWLQLQSFISDTCASGC